MNFAVFFCSSFFMCCGVELILTQYFTITSSKINLDTFLQRKFKVVFITSVIYKTNKYHRTINTIPYTVGALTAFISQFHIVI